MKNDLFTIGSITIHGYGLMIGIGIIAAYYLAEYRANKRGMHPAHRYFTYRNSYVFSLFFSRKSHFQLNSAPQSARSPHRYEKSCTR